jgi:drug/metabolite transporter (DMT)-like permease
MTANLYALGAIALWASLAAIGVQLSHVPPFLLTGLALLIGSLIALPLSRFDLTQWRLPRGTLLLGVYGLFGYHFLLFMALRLAPPVQANLVNYLWPLLIVVLAPVLLSGVRLHAVHVLAALAGFAGAAIAITGGHMDASAFAASTGTQALGYALAFGAAFMWASYSLLTKRVPPFPTAGIGMFCVLSGALSIACHFAFEPTPQLGGPDMVLIAVLGLGPMGAAFFLWDKALKLGDPRKIGVLSFITPLASTVLLLLIRGQALSASIATAAVLIIGAAIVASRARPESPHHA